ncbi:hypothetical protein K502DRAFT_349295 [Neoconidiobolus thromboides FSU 785]|nr:hypothetical protein K502DRAFT_349295 [Neoconidiobolus thromboides FSU 785]
MKLQLEYLSDILLEEVFKLINPKELFHLRSLNKYLFNIVNRAIEYNLSHCVYDKYEFKQYRRLQQLFIEGNGKAMKHLVIKHSNFEYLNYCSNITAVNYKDLFIEEDTIMDGIGNKIEIKLPKLKIMTIDLLFVGCSDILNTFSNYLHQIEVIQLNGLLNENIQCIIQSLNPNRLRSFSLYLISKLNLNGLDIIKSKFTKLNLLCLKSTYITTPSEFNPNISFNSNLELIIEGVFDTNFDMSCLGDLNKLKRVKLIDKSGIYFNRNIRDDNQILNNNGVSIISYFDINNPINNANINLLAPNRIYVNRVSIELLNLIYLLPNIESMCIDRLDFDNKGVFNASKLTISDGTCMEYTSYLFYKVNLIKCNFIKYIIIHKFQSCFDSLFYFMSFFPNLKVIKITHFILENSSIEVNYDPITPLLLITPMESSVDSKAYSELDKIPKLRWIQI